MVINAGLANVTVEVPHGVAEGDTVAVGVGVAGVGVGDTVAVGVGVGVAGVTVGVGVGVARVGVIFAILPPLPTAQPTAQPPSMTKSISWNTAPACV